MKNLMPWIKANLPIVVLSVLILLILPAAFVGSSMWNSKIKKGREKVVKENETALGAAKVSYTLPPTVPGATTVPFAWPAPNPIATAYFRENRAKIEEQIKKVTVEAEAINKAGHVPLVDGVFPAPADKTKTLDFAEALVGKTDSAGKELKPSAYQVLLDRIKAGPAADPVKVAEILNSAKESEVAKLQAGQNRTQFTPEEQAKLDDSLAKIRIGQYMSHAKDISVYATKDAFPGNILRAVPGEPPNVDNCWHWQEDYWYLADLLDAVYAANGQKTGVDQAVVKRIEQIALMPLGDPSTGTLTGRKNGGANKTYDVRSSTMKLIVSSARMPQLINAISKTNFMTVTDLEFNEVDRFKDLEQGFYYGDEHVVEAKVTIESVWLRGWTLAMMPEAEKQRREQTGEEAAPQPAAPAPRAARPASDDEGAAKKPVKKERSTKKPGSGKGKE